MKKRIFAAVVCTVLIAASAGAAVTAAFPQKLTGWLGLSDDAYVWKKGEEVQIELPMLRNALRQYFGLDEDEPLTTDLLEQVTGIRFRLSKYNGNLEGDLEGLTGLAGKTAVKCVINDGVLPGAMYSERANELYGELGYELVPVMVRMKYFDASKITDEWNRTKFMSFFTQKDPADPLLTERAVAEINAMMPNTLVDALMVCDPEAKARELRELANIAAEYGLANMDTLIDGMVIPLTAADTALFPNLETVELLDGLAAEQP
ncbi:MAG: hypothetical protein IJW81_04685 [Clostridia bacterium]|nr:hypothetical protein [Clostridia bacterium]